MYDLFFENHLSKQTVFLSKHNLELVIVLSCTQLSRSIFLSPLISRSEIQLFPHNPYACFLRAVPLHTFSANRFGRGCRLDGSAGSITVPDLGNIIRSRTMNGVTSYSEP